MKLKDLIGVVRKGTVVEYWYNVDGYPREKRTLFDETEYELWDRQIKEIHPSSYDEGVMVIELCD